MRVLLINPPRTFYPNSSAVTVGLPLGIMYIAALLEGKGYDVEILDAFVNHSSPRIEGDSRHYGMNWEQIGREIVNRSPDIVGINCPFSSQVDNAIETADIVKNIDSRILTVVGGPHTSVMATQFLKEANNVDIAVIGEGEYTMLDIASHCEGNMRIGEVQGIAYRDGEDIVESPARAHIGDLDQLPFPAYHLVNMERYLTPEVHVYRGSEYLREISMVTSRGCPYNCVFCSIHLHMGRKWRAHSEDYILRHIDHVITNYGVDHIHFEDDNITLDARRFEAILDGIIQKGLKFIWDVPNGIRADRLTLDSLRKMKKAGCVGLCIGVESGDQFILDNIIDKHLCLEDVVRTARMCKQVKIPLSAFYVIGFPGEKKENIQRTLDFALMLKKKYAVSMLILAATPLYGTRLYEICKEGGYLLQEPTPRALSEATGIWGSGLIMTEDFTPEEIKVMGLDTLRIGNRFHFLRYIKNPIATFKRIRRRPGVVYQFVRTLIRA